MGVSKKIVEGGKALIDRYKQSDVGVRRMGAEPERRMTLESRWLQEIPIRLSDADWAHVLNGLREPFAPIFDHQLGLDCSTEYHSSAP